MSEFKKLVTTPNILTEVNSLANQLKEPKRSQCFSIFSQFLAKLNEKYLESLTIVAEAKFTKFGLTDCGILNLARDKYLVLTDDFKLANYLQSVNIDVINFNHLRNFN